MASLNRVQLIGHLGRDPEARTMPNDGGTITNVSIATTSTWKDKSGDKQEATEWHRIVFFGKLAEVAADHLKKGSQVFVEGKLRTRKWQDKDGQDKYTTEIMADTMLMLGSKPNSDQAESRVSSSSRSASAPAPHRPAREMTPAGFDDDDLPFR